MSCSRSSLGKLPSATGRPFLLDSDQQGARRAQEAQRGGGLRERQTEGDRVHNEFTRVAHGTFPSRSERNLHFHQSVGDRPPQDVVMKTSTQQSPRCSCEVSGGETRWSIWGRVTCLSQLFHHVPVSLTAACQQGDVLINLIFFCKLRSVLLHFQNKFGSQTPVQWRIGPA